MTDSSLLSDRFDNTYAGLPDQFHAKLAPVPVESPELIKLNSRVANLLELDQEWLASSDGLAMLSGNDLPSGSEPLAMAYAGHQFGGWVPQLGDGRAILLGEVLTGDGTRYDLQLKGSGRTPFSRGGDGRAGVGPVIREYVVSEAMHALGIPTTQALAAVSTGEHILREGPTPGAILTRVARSHIRVGTFEFFAARKDVPALTQLADYVISRYYPMCLEQEEPYLQLLLQVIERQAALIAQWQWVGFIHGVMNTDNMNISGETIDYGPCAFLDAYSATKKFSSIDQQGRYAYGNQPRIAQWNLAVLAQCLIPLIHSNEDEAVEKAQAAIDSYPATYQACFENGMRKKLGLLQQQEEDLLLGSELLELMEQGQADFTLTFRHLYEHAKGILSDPSNDISNNVTDNFLQQFTDHSDARQWLQRWMQRLEQDSSDSPDDDNSNSAAQGDTPHHPRLEQMRLSNPAIIPRNHRIEEAISAAVDNKDFGPFHTLVAACSDPYADAGSDAKRKALMLAPLQHEMVSQTFCGT